MIDIFFKKYADFSGRARRKEYWLFVLCYSIAIVVFGGVDGATHNFIGNSKIGLLSCIFYFFMFIPSWSFCIRRLHDTGRSGWWILIGLVPIIGSIVLLIFLCTASDNGKNKYGESPFASIVKPDRERQSQVITKPKKPEQQLYKDLKHDSTLSKELQMNEEDIWEKTLIEFESLQRRSGLWAKLYSESDGNESLAKAKYLKCRFDEIKSESTKQSELKKSIEVSKNNEDSPASKSIAVAPKIEKIKKLDNIEDIWGAFDIKSREVISKYFSKYNSLLSLQDKQIFSEELNLSTKIWSASHQILFSSALFYVAYRDGIEKFKLMKQARDEIAQVIEGFPPLENIKIPEKLNLVIAALLDRVP